VLTLEFPELAGQIQFHIPVKKTNAMARRLPLPACRN
jgi:hypothetical protein